MFGFACVPPIGILRDDDAVERRVVRVLEHDARAEAGGLEGRLRDRDVLGRHVRDGRRSTGPLETESVTVEPFELSEPPFGSWLVDDARGLVGVDVDRGTTPNPARWSSDAAWSYGRPTTFGTVTGLRALRDVDPHLRALDDDRCPALGDCAVTVPSSRSELTSTTCAFEARARELRDRVLDGLADDARDRHLRLPGGDVDADDRLLVDARALGRVLREDDALLDVRARDAADVRDEPGLLDVG